MSADELLTAAWSEQRLSDMDLRHVRFSGSRKDPWVREGAEATGGRAARPRSGDAGTTTVVTPPPRPNEAELAPLADRLLRSHGLDPSVYRPAPLNRRLSACLRAMRTDRADGEAETMLERRPDLGSTALDALLIGVTAFARDEPVFDAMSRVVVPRLAATGGHLRAWSAGCANGAELVTLAVLMAEAGIATRTAFLGTDCRPGAVAAAVAGSYREDELGVFPPEIRSRHFCRSGSQRHPAPALRVHMSWRIADVTRAVEDGPWDVILCRNVAIYLTPETQAALWQRLAGELRPGGFLICGTAERPATRLVRRVAPCIYARREDA